MEGRGGRKPYDIWEHVVKLNGNRVMCKHCQFQFAAPSATRITSHVYSIPNQGIRGCTFSEAANGSGERDKNIARSGTPEVDEMAPKTNLVVLTNMAPEKTKKRKVAAVEVEHAKAKDQGRVWESSVEEVGGEESMNFGIQSPLQRNNAHVLGTTSILRTIELGVASLEEKLDDSVARERILQDELAYLKMKYEKEKTDFLGKITALEAEFEEKASQYSQVKEKLDASEKERANLLGKIRALEAMVEEAMGKAFLLGDAMSYINKLKSKLQGLESEKGELEKQLDSAKKELELASKNPGAPPQIGSNGKLIDLDIDVKIIGWDAMIRIQCRKKNHPVARLMVALKELDLYVHHASVSVVNDLMIQQATVNMGSRFYTQEQLQLVLLSKVGDAQ